MDEEKEGSERQRFSSDISAEELRAAEEYLSSYRHGARMIDCMRYGREFFCGDILPADPLLEDNIGIGADSDETVIRARMYGVKRFITSLKCDANARLLLYWHYVRGVSVTRCADMMSISRAGAFRVRKRALESAARSLRRMKAESKIGDIMPF